MPLATIFAFWCLFLLISLFTVVPKCSEVLSSTPKYKKSDMPCRENAYYINFIQAQVTVLSAIDKEGILK